MFMRSLCKASADLMHLRMIYISSEKTKTCYIKAHVMVSLSLMISYIKHLRYSGKATHFGPFYYIQIDPQDYDEWRISTPEEEIHFQTPSKLGSPATPRSMATSQASESYITLTNFKKGIKRDASAYPILKNERYYNNFHSPLQGNCQGTRIEHPYGSQLHTRIR